jgi:adenylosuccinate synthase
MAALEPKRHVLRAHAKDPALDLHTMTEEYVTYGTASSRTSADTALLCHQTLTDGGTVVFEGAQGTLLDIDHGTYPFVTSSNPIAGAACVGAGVGPKAIDEVWGVAKAYSTRVGEGPFPTELHDDTGRHMLERGHEYGTTTGRQRRCGWIDLVGLRYAARINGLTGLVITKLDVLSESTRCGVHQLHNDEGAVFEEFPYHQSILHSAKAVTEAHPGFTEDIGGCRSIADLPQNARAISSSSPSSSASRSRSWASVPPRAGDLGRRRQAAPRSCLAGSGLYRERIAHRAGQLVRSSMLRSPRRRIRRARNAAASSDAVASVICTPTSPRRDQ